MIVIYYSRSYILPVIYSAQRILKWMLSANRW